MILTYNTKGRPIGSPLHFCRAVKFEVIWLNTQGLSQTHLGQPLVIIISQEPGKLSVSI